MSKTSHPEITKITDLATTPRWGDCLELLAARGEKERDRATQSVHLSQLVQRDEHKALPTG